MGWSTEFAQSEVAAASSHFSADTRCWDFAYAGAAAGPAAVVGLASTCFRRRRVCSCRAPCCDEREPLSDASPAPCGRNVCDCCDCCEPLSPMLRCGDAVPADRPRPPSLIAALDGGRKRQVVGEKLEQGRTPWPDDPRWTAMCSSSRGQRCRARFPGWCTFVLSCRVSLCVVDPWRCK
jgi:hypothetical protein